MGLKSGFPGIFWVAFLINNGPPIPLEFQTTEEVWTGKWHIYIYIFPTHNWLDFLCSY